MGELFELLEARNYARLRSVVEAMNSVDIAEFISGELEDDPRGLIVFRLLPKEVAADVFSYLDSDIQQKIVEGITDSELSVIINELFMDDAVDFIEEMPASIVKRVLTAANHEKRSQINHLLLYPEESAGSLMTTELISLDSDWSVAQAIEVIRKRSAAIPAIDLLFVTTPQRVLQGTVELREILISGDDTTVKSLMRTDVVAVNTLAHQEETADLFKKYDLLSMPVVDNENRLVGIITIDDIIDVIEEETTEDIYRMAAMEPTEDSYIHASVVTLARKRIVWLLVLMISATFTGLIIENFQSVLAVNVLLASFIPMLMDTSGNTGSQSSVSVIRSLVLNEIKFSDTLKVIWKEFRVGILVGAGIAVVNFLRIIIMYQDWSLAWVVSATLYIAVICSNVVGCILPMISTKLKLDPALMASPLITTIVDAVALIIYFSIASAAFNL